MATAASVVVGLVMLITGFLGYRRGLARGYLTIAGTLVSAVLIDLWGEALAAWARSSFRPEGPNIPAWLVISTIFILVALVIGYGGAALLRGATEADRGKKPASMFSSLLAGLLGALNGALLASYPLHYAAVYIPAAGLTGELTTTMLTGLLYAWLPWFVLSIVGAACLLAGIRSLAGLLRPRPLPAAQPLASTSVAAATTPQDKLQAVGNKIDQKIKETGQK